jgi:hypothetical protein
MKEPFEDPPRWRKHSDQSDRAERTIGHDLRAIKTPAPLSGPQMSRIAAGLRPSRTRPSLRWLVLAASLILCGATAASAARLHLLPRWLTGASAPTPMETREARTSHRRPIPGKIAPTPKLEAVPNAPEVPAVLPERQAPAVPETPPAPAPSARHLTALTPSSRPSLTRRDNPGPAPALVPPVQPQVIPSQPTAPVPAALPVQPAPAPRLPQVAMLDPPKPLPSKPVPASPKPVEDAEVSKLLADAIRLLRADSQPQAAMALLDRQASRLDRSPYRHEALLVRVEALLALKRDADLLRLLDGTLLDDVAASRTLLTTRGRLRAAAQRCAEAIADFDRVLSEPGRTNKQALLGRAACREALGDRAGAKADRERYRLE